MPLDPLRWQEVKTHFAELADASTTARASGLAAIADAELRAEVGALLQAAQLVGERFDRPATLPPFEGENAGYDPTAPMTGRQIGAWRLLRLLGEGGMGAVFEAVRDDAGFTKRAALKMIARGVASANLISRFESERRILARLEHRNIAALLDGGVDPDGRPWFALEYVEGERIDRWSAAHHLDLRARVQLFRQACSAVQYAHERLIVHRDLKPANILVAADGTVKLLDFGIAKLTDDSDAPQTQTGLSPMTAAYASPEQRAGQVVTTATDIYSLGVVLYELLTGVRPVADGASDAPTPPSRRLATVSAEEVTRTVAPDADGRRRISRELHGELDAIILMALRPEPDRRYRSAQELSDDLQRWLDGRPVRAQPDTLGYRTSKFIRRNRLAVAGVAVAVAALIGGTVFSVRQARIARAERDRAQREQVRTQRVSQFFQQVLSAAEPRAGGPKLTVIEALDRAVPLIDSAFAKEPDIKAAVQLSIGSTLQNLFLAERARPLLEAGYAWFKAHDGAVPSREQADALWDLATLATSDGRLAEAESMYVAAIPLFARLPGSNGRDADLARARIAGIKADGGDFAGAIALYDSVLPRLPRKSRADSISYAALLGTRGTIHGTRGNLARAAEDLKTSIDIDERIYGPESFVVGEALQPYAGVLLFLRRTADAEAAARRGLAINERTVGSTNPKTQTMRRMLATILVTDDRCAEALPVLQTILQSRGTSSLPETDPTVGHALLHLGYCEARLGRPAQGIPHAREGLALWRGMFDEQHYARHLAESLTGAALGYGSPANAVEAERLMRAGADGLRKTLDPSHPRVADAEARLDAFLTRRSAVR